MDEKRLVRLMAIILLVSSVLACAVEPERLGQAFEPSRSSIQDPNDSLAAELRRCKSLGPEDVHDAACKDAWARNRDRFLVPAPSGSDELSRALPQRPSVKLPSEMFPERAPFSLWPDANQIRSRDR